MIPARVRILRLLKFIGNSKVDLLDSGAYFVVSIAAQLISFQAVNALKTAISSLGLLSGMPLYCFGIIADALLIYLPVIPLIASHARKQYVFATDQRNDRSVCIKNGLLYFAPCELLRFLISFTDINTGRFMGTKFGKLTCRTVNILLTTTYGKLFDREFEVGNITIFDVEYIAADYIAYTICHLIWLIPHLCLTLSIYRRHWNKEGTEYAAMHARAEYKRSLI